MSNKLVSTLRGKYRQGNRVDKYFEGVDRDVQFHIQFFKINNKFTMIKHDSITNDLYMQQLSNLGRAIKSTKFKIP